MNLRGIRGATTVEVDERGAIESSVIELIKAMMERNSLTEAEIISIIFTATVDLKSEFPATAARRAGLSDTPLICAREIDVAGALPRTIRVLMHVETERSKGEIEHVYLREAISLRKDISK
jgi:chorismate mutase